MLVEGDALDQLAIAASVTRLATTPSRQSAWIDRPSTGAIASSIASASSFEKVRIGHERIRNEAEIRRHAVRKRADAGRRLRKTTSWKHEAGCGADSPEQKLPTVKLHVTPSICSITATIGGELRFGESPH